MSINAMTVAAGIGTYALGGTAYGAVHFINKLNVKQVADTVNGYADINARLDKLVNAPSTDANPGLNAQWTKGANSVTALDSTLTVNTQITEAGKPTLIAVVANSIPPPARRIAQTVNLPATILAALETTMHMNHMQVAANGLGTCGSGNDFCAEEFTDILETLSPTNNASIGTALTNLKNDLLNTWNTAVTGMTENHSGVVSGIKLALLPTGPTVVATACS